MPAISIDNEKRISQKAETEINGGFGFIETIAFVFLAFT
jgi:hypothetical protein